MNHRSRVATLAVLILFLLVSVLVVRGAVRGLSAPFEGLERLAQARRAAPPEPERTLEETVRAIDWDAPAPGPPVRKATAAVNSGEVLAVLDRGKAVQLEFAITLRVGTGEELVSWVSIGHEIDIDSLASSLKLSDSQKARIAGLMEWRRWWDDRLTDAQKADAEGMKKFDESFHEAVRMELEQEQAQAFQKMRPSRVQLLEFRGTAQVALEQVASDSMKTWATERQKQYKKTVK